MLLGAQAGLAPDHRQAFGTERPQAGPAGPREQVWPNVLHHAREVTQPVTRVEESRLFGTAAPVPDKLHRSPSYIARPPPGETLIRVKG